MMAEFGFGDRWIYRNGADGKFHGAGEAAARDLIKNGDLLVNVSSAGWLKDYDFGVKHQMFIDGDPMFCQVGLLDPKNADYAARVRAHDSHFTFGLNVGAADCLAPDTGIRWKKTVQPIALDCWPVQTDEGARPLHHGDELGQLRAGGVAGKTYGQKDLEFDKFKHLPRRTPQHLEMAMGQGIGAKRPTEELRALGWTILEAGDVLPDHRSYHEFLRTSKAEWSVAKHGYVAGAHRLVQLPHRLLPRARPARRRAGNRLERPSSPPATACLRSPRLEEAVDAIADINDHYAEHQAAARALAEQYFEARKVCDDLLAQAGIG